MLQYNSMGKIKQMNPKKTITIIIALGIYVTLAQTITGSICVVYSTVGFPCPGCGLTRAYLALFRGEIGAAFFAHPLFWLVPICLALVAFQARLTAATYRTLVFAAIAAFLAVYALRLLIFFPHTAPMVLNHDSALLRLWGLLLALLTREGAA
jgi:hypothetical protein